MKKIIAILTALVLMFSVFGCGKEEQSPRIPQEEFDKLEVLADTDFNKLYTDITPYKGKRVQFAAQVFSEPQVDDNGVVLQVFADPQNNEKNTFVTTEDSDFKVATDDYIIVDGLVYDSIEYENRMGATMAAPQILAYTLEVTDYMHAIAPSTKSIEVNQSQDHYGYSLTLQKVELSEIETRVYISITNNSDEKINFYSFNANLIQSGAQFEEQTNYNADYPKISSSILPGVTSAGIVTFPKIEDAPVTVRLEGSSDNWLIDIEPFVFEVNQ